MINEMTVVAQIDAEVGYTDGTSASFGAVSDEDGNAVVMGDQLGALGDILSIILAQIFAPIGGGVVMTSAGSGRVVNGYFITFYGRVSSPTLGVLDWYLSYDKFNGLYMSPQSPVAWREAVLRGAPLLSAMFTALSGNPATVS